MTRSLTTFSSSHATPVPHPGSSNPSVSPHLASPPALFALVRVLARQAAAEFLAGARQNLTTGEVA